MKLIQFLLVAVTVSVAVVAFVFILPNSISGTAEVKSLANSLQWILLIPVLLLGAMILFPKAAIWKDA